MVALRWLFSIVVSSIAALGTITIVGKLDLHMMYSRRHFWLSVAGLAPAFAAYAGPPAILAIALGSTAPGRRLELAPWVSSVAALLGVMWWLLLWTGHWVLDAVQVGSAVFGGLVAYLALRWSVRQ
jgi:hypothetical protein